MDRRAVDEDPRSFPEWVSDVWEATSSHDPAQTSTSGAGLYKTEIVSPLSQVGVRGSSLQSGPGDTRDV